MNLLNKLHNLFVNSDENNLDENSEKKQYSTYSKTNDLGVATKYLNNYLVYHNFVNFANESEIKKESILFSFVRETLCESKTFDSAKRRAITV